MKKEIVYTDKYALILSDEALKKGDWMYRGKEGAVLNTPDYWFDFKEPYKKIIAHLPLSNAPILEGVPLLPSFSWGQQDDTLTIAELVFPYDIHRTDVGTEDCRKIFVLGYNKAKEKYKYTEDDLRNSMYIGCQISKKIGSKYMIDLKDIEDYIQSLQQPSRPTHFECEMMCGRCRSINDECWNAKECTRGCDYPDIIRTITDSQGLQELVGKYI